VWKVVADHYEGFAAAYEGRHRETWGRPRRVVERTVAEFLGCGRLDRGFARLRCPGCHEERLLAFSCKTRGLCTSCGAKRTAAWAAWFTGELARDVPHRHVVVTLPKLLRPYFKFDRSLLTDLARWTFECLRELMAALADEPVRPGCVAVLELAGNLLNLQPHVHLIVTSGAFDASGVRFYPLRESFDRELLALVTERVLRELHGRGLLPDDRLRLIRSWRHTGFSVFVGRPIAASDGAALERLARYVRRFHLAESRVLYDEGHDRVIYHSARAPHPGFKANFRVFEARDFLADLVGFIPDAYQHESVAYGEYSNVVRGRRRRADSPPRAPETVEPRPVRGRWRELIRRIYEVDPLLCPCGGAFRVVALVTERDVIERILRGLGLWRPPRRPPKSRRAAPPERARDARRAPVQPDEDSQVPPWWDDDAALFQGHAVEE
jgi:hypothetical protein